MSKVGHRLAVILGLVAIDAGCATEPDNGTVIDPPQYTISAVAGDHQTGVWGDPLPINPSVRVVERNGHPAVGITVLFAPASGINGTVTGGSVTTDSSGLAVSGPWTLGRIGAQQLVVTVPDATSNEIAINATAQDILVLVRTAGISQVTSVGTPVADRPSVRITSLTAGNFVVGLTVTFSVDAGGGTITGATATTDANGIATVGSWTLGSTPGLNHLTATVTYPKAYTAGWNATATP
jgi:adhesin/invasin